MKPISALSCPTARPAEASLGVRRPEEARQPEAPGSGRLSKPAVDEYIPETPQEASGRYWPGRDENGRPRICFDGQPSAADAPQGKNGAKEPAPKEERCAGNTDQADREIRRLKREKAELERQIAAEPREDKRRSLEKQLDQVEAQLRQKDNDAYRKRHTKFS